jgi:Trp operon repressor
VEIESERTARRRERVAGRLEVVTKLVEPSIPQRGLTRSLFVDTDLSYTHQGRGSRHLLLT